MAEDKKENTRYLMQMNNGPSPSPGRLPSFKPRDLKLLTLQSGNSQLLNNFVRPRRNFAPNINAQRMKDKCEAEVKPDLDVRRNHVRFGSNKRDEKDRDKNDRRKFKGNNVIQSSGIFAEGYGTDMKRRWEPRSGGGGTSDRHSSGEPMMEKPKLKLENNYIANKDEENEDLQLLLRDDFLDDPNIRVNEKNGPVKLPLKKSVKVKIEKEIKDVKVNLKSEDTSNDSKDVKKILFGTSLIDGITSGGVKVKQEPVDPDDPFSVPPVDHSNINEEKPKLIFFEFPDVLPISEFEPSNEQSKPSTEKKKPAVLPQVQEEQEVNKKRTLRDLSEGRLGTLQVLKSGKIRLMLGYCPMHVELGTSINFRQDLIAVNLDDSDLSGKMTKLGTINNTVVCSPDLQEIVCKSEKR